MPQPKNKNNNRIMLEYYTKICGFAYILNINVINIKWKTINLNWE
jgi:hypothetical protein